MTRWGCGTEPGRSPRTFSGFINPNIVQSGFAKKLCHLRGPGVFVEIRCGDFANPNLLIDKVGLIQTDSFHLGSYIGPGKNFFGGLRHEQGRDKDGSQTRTQHGRPQCAATFLWIGLNCVNARDARTIHTAPVV
jgi:hypothetical protein